MIATQRFTWNASSLLGRRSFVWNVRDLTSNATSGEDEHGSWEIIDLPEANGLVWNEEEQKSRKLNKPFRTPGGPKKFAVYAKNDKGNVVLVRFGDPNMEIKRDDPGRRKNFRARHGCDDPGPKWKAKWWSCKFWSKSSVGDLLGNYSNAQPRDSYGRWSSGGGGGVMSPDTGGGSGGSGGGSELSSEEWAAGLPSSQRASIEKWVNGDQSKIRALQADKQIPPKDRKKYAKRLDEMNAALENAPRVEGTLYRGMAVKTDADILKKLNVGSVLELEAHSSSSSDASTAACFSDKYGLLGDRVQVLMKINQKTGVDISPVANKTYAWQKEHLLLKGSRYRVDSIKTESVEAHWNEPGSSGRPKTVDNVMIVEMSEI